MDQEFRWGDPYTDLQAQNVQDGSVSYYNFDWGESVRSLDEECEEECRRPCTGCKPECGCTEQENICQDTPLDGSEQIQYEIVQE